MKKFIYVLAFFIFATIKSYATDIKFVQIDNLKFSPYSEDSVQNFKNTVKDINKQKDVSFVIFTGNNIAKSDKKYLAEFLKSTKKLDAPCYVALGHKDLNKKKGLTKLEYMKKVKNLTHKNIKQPNYIFAKNGVVFIVADGAKEFIQTPFGYYREDVIQFVDTKLTENADKNAVILQHFPIYPPKNEDAYRTYKSEDYFEMLGKHKNVKAVVSGFGVNSENDVNGIKHITTAGYPQYRIIEIIDCTGDNPTIWSTLK